MSWTAPPTFVAGTVFTAANANILANDLSFLGGVAGNRVNPLVGTSSTSYTDLAGSAGPAVTVTTGTSAVVAVQAFMQSNTSFDTCYMAYAVSGATTIAAGDNGLIFNSPSSGVFAQWASVALITGLTAGSNVFTAKYRASAGIASFANRNIAVWPLP